MKDIFAGGWLGKKRVGVLLVIMAVSFSLGYGLRGGGRDARQSAQFDPPRAPDAETAQVEERLIYMCPMMCVPPMEKAGSCPVCGMELTPVPAGEESGPPRLKLASQAVKLAEIQVAPVERRFVSADVKLYGQIDYDPAHTTTITAFMPGVIDRVYVKRAGQFVRWGDPLFDLYSSDLLDTQRQLSEVMRYVPGFLAFQGSVPHAARDVRVQEREAAADPSKRSPEVESALKTIAGLRHKLSILGLPKRDIDEFMKVGEATGIATVYAPMYGQVVEQNAFEGAYVNTGTTIFTLADPLFVWARLDAYEMDYPWIRKGQKVSFKADAYPGETFEGEVVYIDPVFKTKTRTFTIGVLSTEDKGGRLKAGMIVRAVIHARLTADGKVANEKTREEEAPLVIPASAPLITGKRAVVYVAVPGEQGVFEGREVVLGPRANQHYVVMAGLEEGESVVVNGNFKIDSAVQILAKSSMMDIEGGHSAVEHQHHGGSSLMHEDYWSERMQSRMGDAGNSPPSNGGMHSVEHPGGSREDAPSRSPSTIHRRRPGMYGDTTRGMSPAREH